MHGNDGDRRDSIIALPGDEEREESSKKAVELRWEGRSLLNHNYAYEAHINIDAFSNIMV